MNFSLIRSSFSQHLKKDVFFLFFVLLCSPLSFTIYSPFSASTVLSAMPRAISLPFSFFVTSRLQLIELAGVLWGGGFGGGSFGFFLICAPTVPFVMFLLSIFLLETRAYTMACLTCR